MKNAWSGAGKILLIIDSKQFKGLKKKGEVYFTMEERRKHKRLEIDVQVQLKSLDESGASTVSSVPVEVTDVSHSGLGFCCQAELEVQTYYDTKIQIWTKEILPVVIKIIRKEVLPDGRRKYGCEFIGMTDTDALKIDIYEMCYGNL